MQATLSETALPPGKRFLCLSERGCLDWPWLREQQITSLRRFLQASPNLEYATKVFDNINTRFAAHATCGAIPPLPASMHAQQRPRKLCHSTWSAAAVHGPLQTLQSYHMLYVAVPHTCLTVSVTR